MDRIDSALSTAQSQIEEVIGNVKIRDAFKSFFIANARELYAWGSMRAEVKSDLNKIMKNQYSDSTAVYRGLYIELSGILELFVRNLMEAAIHNIESAVSQYADLPEEFRKQHSFFCAKTMILIHDGQINGVKYDFDRLQRNLSSCYSTSSFNINRDVFTNTMGVSNSEKLKKVFKAVGISPPFDDDFGKSKELQLLIGTSGVKRAANEASDRLDEFIRKRNEMVHSPGVASVSATDIEDTAKFLVALFSALASRVRDLNAYKSIPAIPSSS